MTRVQILLSEDEDRRLEQLARKQRESKSSVVRRALKLLLRLETDGDEPLLELIAQAGRTGERHGARDHDRLLVQALQQRRTR
jgi:predicted transcriptional regulator